MTTFRRNSDELSDRTDEPANVIDKCYGGKCHHTQPIIIGADFQFEVPGQSSVGLIGGRRGQWLGGTMASAEHKCIMGVWRQSPWSGGQGGEAPLKLKAFWSSDVQRSRQI